LRVQNFKFMKQLGLKKPAFLPDFGLDKRTALLNKTFTTFDRSALNEVLADNFYIQEGDGAKFSKEDWVGLLVDYVKPSIPDFNWGHATDGSKDDEGYSIVTVQANGHHTGKAFTLPKPDGGMLPEVPTSNKRFKLAEERIKVKTEDGKVQHMVVLPVKGAGPLALYKALGGQVPEKLYS
jgi:hypothetical protein